MEGAGWNPRSAPGRGEDNLPYPLWGERGGPGAGRAGGGEAGLWHTEWALFPKEGERKQQDWIRTEDSGPSLTTETQEVRRLGTNHPKRGASPGWLAEREGARGGVLESCLTPGIGRGIPWPTAGTLCL